MLWSTTERRTDVTTTSKMLTLFNSTSTPFSLEYLCFRFGNYEVVAIGTPLWIQCIFGATKSLDWIIDRTLWWPCLIHILFVWIDIAYIVRRLKKEKTLHYNGFESQNRDIRLQTVFWTFEEVWSRSDANNKCRTFLLTVFYNTFFILFIIVFDIGDRLRRKTNDTLKYLLSTRVHFTHYTYICIFLVIKKHRAQQRSECIHRMCFIWRIHQPWSFAVVQLSFVLSCNSQFVLHLFIIHLKHTLYVCVCVV